MQMEHRTDYHKPVLLAESIDALGIRPDGIYVDATLGGGGHARAVLERLGEFGMLLAFDQDADAQSNCPDDPRCHFLPFNFRYLKRALYAEGIRGVHGILADLGVSSHQLDQPHRGFSHRFSADLDMRMSAQGPTSAAQILNEYSAEALQEVFGRYGEVRNARTLAQTIVRERQRKPIRTTDELLYLLEPLIRGERHRYLSQVFQALRIEVNDEMNALSDFLRQATDLLHTQGRLVVISYHSLEDRLVKNWMLHGTFDDQPEKDFYGNYSTPLQPLHRKPLLPSDQELAENSRSRSAKLRTATKK